MCISFHAVALMLLSGEQSTPDGSTCDIQVRVRVYYECLCVSFHAVALMLLSGEQRALGKLTAYVGHKSKCEMPARSGGA